MGHDYGVPLRFLAITPTRDNAAAPGNRLSDKHLRLFHGKTLDEWCALQVLASKYHGRHIFIAETEAHAERLLYLEEYGCEVWVRPRDMLHSLNDSGGIPINWVMRKVLDEDWHTLVTHPFVVAPCRPPGFFDRMVERFCEVMDCPDYSRGQMWVLGGHKVDATMFDLDMEGRAKDLGETYINLNPRWRLSSQSHMMALSNWYLSHYHLVVSRHDPGVRPYIVDIEPWEDIHIDTQDDWDAAEFWFKKKILDVYGKDCYETYREKQLSETSSDNSRVMESKRKT